MTGIEVMLSILGKQEARDEEFLKDFFKRNSVHNDIYLNPNGSEQSGQPWCAASVNGCERQAYGLQAGTGRLNARSFLKYGKIIYDKALKIGKITDGRYGDIAIWERGNNGWSGHVNYILELKIGAYRCIGGNQGDAVTEGEYTFLRLLGIRRSPYVK